MDANDEKLIVASVKWGTKYGPEYVNILHNMVKRFLSVPFEFYCLTDDAVGLDERINIIEIDPNALEGWWNKITLFRPGIFPNNSRVLYLDLDIVIVGNLDFLLKSSAPFTILKSWKTKYLVWNSSVMLFTPSECHHIYERFQKQSKDVIAKYKGDQDWIFECTKDTAHNWADEKIISFKRHCNALVYPRLNRMIKKFGSLPALPSASCPPPPEGAAIICFHGRPNPADVKDRPYKQWKRAPFVADNWR